MDATATQSGMRLVEGRAAANGLELAYDDRGDEGAPAILLIMGLGTQLLGWPEAFCDGLAAEGFRVIRFDNRDIGLSTKIEGAGRQDGVRAAFVKSSLGLPVRAPYRLDDMADDTLGLLDALDLDSAHVVGASMGGMIGQILAARRPARVASLTSVMSSSGARGLPRGRLKVLMRLGSRPPSAEPEVVVEHLTTTMRLIGSPGIQRSRAEWAELIRRGMARSHYPAGTARQLLAILASSSREPLLREIARPSLVIHGDADPLVPPAHGEHTAACIPGARLEVIPGMGHDLPPVLVPALVGLIADHARAAGP